MRVVFSGMDVLLKASNKDSRVADRSCAPSIGATGFVPGWGCSGVSPASTSVSGLFCCVGSIREDCGRDCVRLAGMVRVLKGQGYCCVTLGQPVEKGAVDSIIWCQGKM